MNDASLASFLSAEEAAAFQLGMLRLLSEEIPRFNRGRSSSVRVETAQSLMESLLYSITAYVQTLPDPAAALRTIAPAELRARGLSLLKQYVEESRVLLKQAQATRVETELRVYNDTLDLGIPAFLQAYDPEFAAHEATALNLTFDYPLQRQPEHLSGVLYIKAYLEELIRENEFCARYGKNYIRALLLTHGVKHRLDYREMILNIPELILEHEGKVRPAPGP